MNEYGILLDGGDTNCRVVNGGCNCVGVSFYNINFELPTLCVGWSIISFLCLNESFLLLITAITNQVSGLTLGGGLSYWMNEFGSELMLSIIFYAPFYSLHDP